MMSIHSSVKPTSQTARKRRCMFNQSRLFSDSFKHSVQLKSITDPSDYCIIDRLKNSIHDFPAMGISNQDQTTVYSTADHHPTLLSLPITYTAHHTNLDEHIPHPAYHKISSIPMRLQPPPPDDPNAPAWFVIDQPNHITDKQHQIHTQLLSRIDHTHNYPAVQDIIPTIESALTSLEDQVIASTSKLNLHDNPYHTVPRTKHLRHQIDEIYDKIERGINLTLDIANIHQTKNHTPRISPNTLS